MAKDGHERQEIERKRQQPQERSGRHVRADIGRDRNDQASRDRRQHDPAQPVACRNRRIERAGSHNVPAARAEQTGDRDQNCKPAKAQRPDLRLQPQRKKWLDCERIGNERGERAEIGGRVQHVGIVRVPMAGRGVPALQQRRTR